MFKAVFLDRDRTLILPTKNSPMITKLGDFYIPKEYVESLQELVKHKYLIFIVTNQGGIAHGYVSLNQVENVHRYIENFLIVHGIKINKIEFCPHHSNGKISPYNIDCNCRKPGIGMFLKISQEYPIDIDNSWMIGDSDIDIEAGVTFGVKSILVKSGNSLHHPKATVIVDDLPKAIEYILANKFEHSLSENWWLQYPHPKEFTPNNSIICSCNRVLSYTYYKKTFGLDESEAIKEIDKCNNKLTGSNL